MADKDDIKAGKDFGIGIPQTNKAFFLRALAPWIGACRTGWPGSSTRKAAAR